MRKILFIIMLFCLHGMARGQTDGYHYLYWFDANQATLQEGHSATPQWQLSADISKLSGALHTLFVMVSDNKGRYTQPVTRTFVKVNDDKELEGYYWFDKNTAGLQKSSVVNGIFDVDALHLSDGFHSITFQTRQNDGSMTQPIERHFVKVAQTENVEYITCVCCIDGEKYKEQRLPSNGGIIEWEFDASDLSFGVHRIQVLAVTPSGAATPVYESFFIRVNTSDELNQMYCVYSVDGKPSGIETCTAGYGTYHFNIDMSQLTDGVHRLSYLLTDGRGMSTVLQTHFFMKNPVGGNGITKYEYWINDLAEQLHQTEFSEKVDPYHLAALLPVESQPLRSSQFHFELTNGQPYMYAKNSLHVRFYDITQRFTDTAEEYVDYAVAQAITDVDKLFPGVKETTNMPVENTVKWYKLDVEHGDSLRFRVDKACTIQLFAPSGAEVYNVQGAEAVKWGGLHAKETGTFYLALHDVTATKGTTLSIDYDHIDKYAVLRQDVHIVGNGAPSIITYDGNGFDDLYDVCYISSDDEVLHATRIDHVSNTETAVVFDFAGCKTGRYKAVFFFTDGQIELKDNLEITDPKDIILTIAESHPNKFLLSSKLTYKVDVTNLGNMTANRVPMFTIISPKNLEGLKHLDIEGLNLPPLIHYLDRDGLDDQTWKEMLELSDEVGSLHYFIPMPAINVDGDTTVMYCGVLYLDIAPNSTRTIKFHMKGSGRMEAWFYIPDGWDKIVLSASSRAKIWPTTECDWHNLIKWINLIQVGLDIVSVFYPPVALLSCTNSYLGTIASSLATNGTPDGMSLAGTLINCIPLTPPLKKILKDKLMWQARVWSAGMHIDVYSTYRSWAEKCNTESKITNYPGEESAGGRSIGGGYNYSARLNRRDIDDCGSGDGGGSKGVYSFDPNEIYGYEAESGSKAVKDGFTDVSFTVQFENDTTFATAAAHDIWVRDTLDSKRFDLSTYKPRKVRIGNKELELDGSPNFIATLGMQPEINAVAQVEGTFDVKTGIVCWHLSSLDPMTVEPTNDVMQGILPVNYDGQGIGEVTFDINLKDDLDHGTKVNNRASIVFDTNEPIMTPTWTNIIDRIAPESHVSDVKMLNDTTVAVSIAATDELSGPWRYNVYVQYGDGAWFLGAENVPIDKAANVKVFEGIDHGFYTVVTDSAGNVEQKAAAREYTFEVFAPQTETNTKLQLAEGWNWMSQNQNTALSAEVVKPKALRIKSQTEELYKDARFGWTGDLDELLPTQMYKVQMGEAAEVQLGGLLFNAAFRSIPLREGWNWIGYPVAKTMTPAEALAKFEAEEDDAIIGRDGLITYNDGQWMGTLTEMQPGQGYMFRSVSDKSLFLNAMAQSSSRRVGGVLSIEKPEYPDNWTVDKRKYPNVMGIVAELYQDEKPVSDCGEWLLGAFCGDECRGLAQTVGHQLMMNVYGQGGEKITFLVMHRESGEILGTSESEEFRSGLLGSVRQPYILNIGVPTGIVSIDNGRFGKGNPVYDLQGRKVDGAESQKGVYIVTDGKNGETQKVVRR